MLCILSMMLTSRSIDVIRSLELLFLDGEALGICLDGLHEL